MGCDRWLPRLFPYADGELDPESREGLEAHARDCAECRRRIELERAFREIYVAPLRPDEAPVAVRQSALALLERLSVPRAGRLRLALRTHAPLLAAGVIGLLLGAGAWAGLGLWEGLDRAGALQALAHESVHHHQRLTQHIVPYDIAAVSPAEAERWFRQRLDFNVSLPDRTGEGSVLRGGRLTHLGGIEAAGLHYEMAGQDVSLFVLPASEKRSPLPDGERRFRRLTRDGYDVFIWESKGLRYALVSEIGERSCLVCHPADRQGQIATFAPRKAMP